MTSFSPLFPFQSGPEEINVFLEKHEILIGDQINYVIEVKHHADISVSFPKFGGRLGDFEVLNAEQKTMRSKENDLLVEKMELLLSAYKLGNLRIPPVSIKLVTKAGKTHETAAPATAVYVKSLLPGGPAENLSLHDIKSVVDLQASPKSAMLYFLVLPILGVALILGLYILRGRRTKKLIKQPQPEPITPEEEILREIEKLWNSGLVARKAPKTFYRKLTVLIKTYLGRRYKLQTRELTTYEIVRYMVNQQVNKQLVIITQRVFKICDLVKFSSYAPSEDESKWLLDQATFIIKFEQTSSMNQQ